jgi:hypothetical protein
VIDEDLIDLAGPVGRCSSTAAIGIARRLAAGRDPGARLHRLAATEGISDDATATRWEASFDLPTRMATLDLVVTFTWDEDRRAFGSGVASLRTQPFPSSGSELERMLVTRVLPRRRLKGIWKQHLADRKALPDRVPDACEALIALRDQGFAASALQRMVATVSASGGPGWTVVDESGEHRVRWHQDGDQLRLVV